MANQTYKLTYQITADVQQALASLEKVKKSAEGLTVGNKAMKSPFVQWAVGRDFDTFKGKISAMGTSLKSHFSSLGMSLKTIFWSIPTGFISGLGIAKNMIAGLIGMAKNVGFTALKWGGIGLGAAYAANKALAPAATDETLAAKLQVNNMAEMLPYFKKFAMTSSTANTEEVMESAIILKNQGLDFKSYLQTLSDAAAGSGKSMSEFAHMIAMIKSGNVMGSFRQLTNLGIGKAEMERQGIKFDKTPMGEEEIKMDAASRDKVLASIMSTLAVKYKGASGVMSNTMTDKLGDFTQQLRDTLSDLGTQFLPAAKNLVENLIVVAKAFGSPEGRENILSAFKQSWNIFVEGIPGIIGDLVASLINVSARIIEIISGWFSSGDALNAFIKLGESLYTGLKAGLIGKRTVEDINKELGLAQENLAYKPGKFLGIQLPGLNEKEKQIYQDDINRLQAEKDAMLKTPERYQPNLNTEGVLVTTHMTKVASDIGSAISTTIAKEKERQLNVENLPLDVAGHLSNIGNARLGKVNEIYTNPASITDALLQYKEYKSDYAQLSPYDKRTVDQNTTQFQKNQLDKLEKIAQALEIIKMTSKPFSSIMSAPDFTY